MAQLSLRPLTDEEIMQDDAKSIAPKKLLDLKPLTDDEINLPGDEISTLEEPAKKGFYDKFKNWGFGGIEEALKPAGKKVAQSMGLKPTREQEIAKAGIIIDLAKQQGIEPHVAEQNYNDIIEKEYRLLTPDKQNEKMTQVLMASAAGFGLATAPVATLANIGKFIVTDEALKTVAYPVVDAAKKKAQNRPYEYKRVSLEQAIEPETPTARLGANIAEFLIAGQVMKAAETAIVKPILKSTINTALGKMIESGWIKPGAEGEISISKERFDKIASGTPIEKAIAQYIKVRNAVVPKKIAGTLEGLKPLTDAEIMGGETGAPTAPSALGEFSPEVSKPVKEVSSTEQAFKKPAVGEISPKQDELIKTIGKTVGIDAQSGLPIIDRTQKEEAPEQGEIVPLAGKETAKQAISVPAFKSTGEALRFGKENKENRAVLDELQRLRASTLNEAEQMETKENKTDDDWNAMIEKVTESQFYREALEAAGESAADMPGHISKQPKAGGKPASELTPQEQRAIEKINPDKLTGVELDKDIAVKDLFGNTKNYKKGESIYIYQDPNTGKAIVKDGDYGVLPNKAVQQVEQAGSKWENQIQPKAGGNVPPKPPSENLPARESELPEEPKKQKEKGIIPPSIDKLKSIVHGAGEKEQSYYLASQLHEIAKQELRMVQDRIGKIRPYENKKELEEYRALNPEWRTNKPTAPSPDEAKDMLSDTMGDFENESDMYSYLNDLSNRVKTTSKEKNDLRLTIDEKNAQKLDVDIQNKMRKYEEKITDQKELREKTIKKFNEKELTAKEAKKFVEKYIRDSFEPKDRGRFLVLVRDVKTPEQAARAFSRIDRYIQKIELKNAISKLKGMVEKFTESPSISVDYRNKIKNIIGDYELSGHVESTINKLKATQDYIDRQKSKGEDVEIPQRLLDKLKILSRIPRDQISIKDVQALKSEIELLARLGETKWASKQALYDSELELRKESLLKTAAPINFVERGKRPIGSDPKLWADRYIKLRNYKRKSTVGLTPIDGLADITGMTKMKAALDLNYGDYLTYNDSDFKMVDEIIKKYGLKDSNFDRAGYKAISMNEGGTERLIENNDVTQEEIDKVKLSEGEQKLYEKVRADFEKVYPFVKKYMMDIYNVDVGKVDNYVSFMTDYEFMSDLEMYDRFGTRAEEEFERRTKTVKQGFTKERAKMAKNPLETNLIKIYHRHMDDVAYLINMGKQIKMYSEIVNSPEMREKLGDLGSLAWLQYLDLMARKGGSDSSKRIAALDIARRNVGAGVLAFRISSTVVQLSSFADTIATIGSEWATKGAHSIATSPEWRNFIIDNFQEVKKAIGDDIAFREFDSAMFSKVIRKGFMPLQFLDGIMRSTASAGAYQKLAQEKGISIDLKNPDKELIQEATKLMRQSQGSSFAKDQPLALTTGFGITDNRSLNKTLFQFGNFMLNRWDNINRQIWRMGLKEKNYKKAAGSFFWLVVFAIALEEGLRSGTRNVINYVTGEKEEEKKKSLTKNILLNVAQNIPILGQLVSSMTYGSNAVPIINAIESAAKGLSKTARGKHIETKIKGVIDALGGVATVLGIPGSSQAAQILRKAAPEPKKKSSNKWESIL